MQNKNVWTANDETKIKMKRTRHDCVEEDTSNLAKQKPSKVSGILNFSRKSTVIPQNKADFSMKCYLYLPVS